MTSSDFMAGYEPYYFLAVRSRFPLLLVVMLSYANLVLAGASYSIRSSYTFGEYS